MLKEALDQPDKVDLEDSPEEMVLREREDQSDPKGLRDLKD